MLAKPGLEANLTGAAMMGIERRNLLNRPMSRFMNRPDEIAYNLHLKSLFTSPLARSYEIRLVRPDGSRFWVHLNGKMVFTDNKESPRAWITMTGITERKRVEETLAIRLHYEEKLATCWQTL